MITGRILMSLVDFTMATEITPVRPPGVVNYDKDLFNNSEIEINHRLPRGDLHAVTSTIITNSTGSNHN